MSTTTVAPRPAYPSLRAAALPLAALCLAFFVEMVDNTLLTVALPTIGRDLGSGTTALQWVTGAYSLTFGGLLLTAGSTADRLGRRRVLLAGLLAFGAVSLTVLWVTDAAGLIAVRAALGVAAAAMAPVTMSLIFRLFDDERLRMRAISVVMVVGLSGFVLGPILAGTVLTHVRWEWLLVVNAPIAAVAALGVWFGIPRDRSADLTRDGLDLRGALLSVATIGLACYALTAGVEHGWVSVATLLSAAGAVVAGAGFVRHEQRAASPMLDLALVRTGPVRGAALAQVGSSIAMAGVMFGLILHFQYAWGWSPMRAGLANLPLILTMLAASPFSEALARRLGHRRAVLVAAALLAAGLVAMAWGVQHGYPAVAIAMVVMTLGLRTVMTICAVALVSAMPENRTSIGAAMNDTAQEVGTSVGTALVGTLIAALVTTQLPPGTWSAALVADFLSGERTVYAVLAVLVGGVVALGARSLTDSRTAEEPH